MICRGASAGGLPVAALCNEYPDLLAGAVLRVPYLDLLTSLLDTSLPLTIHEHEEWGDPASDEATLQSIQALCPVQNVFTKAKEDTIDHYPHIFATGSMLDERVQYWHPAKFVAALRAKNHSNTFLVTSTDTGHFDRTLESDALEIAFCLRTVEDDTP